MTRPPLEILKRPLSEYPGFNRFVLDWLHGIGTAAALLPRAQREARCPGSPRGRDALVGALIESNRRWGIDAAPALQQWNAGQSAGIIAGQQAGFAGGPLYTIAKIATLLAMKRDNEMRGVPTTVFFWLATEDHDFDEVATLNLPANDGLRQLHARAPEGHRQPVGPMQIPAALIDELLTELNIERPAWLAEGATFGDSFARLLATVFGDRIVLVDSLLPELRREGTELFLRILDSWNEIQQAISRQSSLIRKAGYAPQVVPREGDLYSLLFWIDDDGDREPIHRNGSWRIGQREVSFSALIDLVREQPHRVSTAALMRPLLQDLVFAPDVFVGGPAEVSYYAQLSTVHALVGVAVPEVALRGHVLVAPSRVLRSMQRFAIDGSEIFKPVDEMVASRESDALTEMGAAALRGHEALDREIAKIAALVLPADRGLERSINRTIGHINFHFDKLVERSTRALVRRDRERFSALHVLSSTLDPGRTPQDRVTAWLPYWLQYGEALIESMVANVEPDTDVLTVVPL